MGNDRETALIVTETGANPSRGESCQAMREYRREALKIKASTRSRHRIDVA